MTTATAFSRHRPRDLADDPFFKEELDSRRQSEGTRTEEEEGREGGGRTSRRIGE